MKQRDRIQRRRALALVIAGLLVSGVILGCALGLAEMDSSSLRMAVSDLDLTVYIPSPVNGAMPVYSLQGKQYTGSVTWVDSYGFPVTTPFQLGGEYTGAVTLQARAGYSFTGKEPFFHGGADEVLPGTASGNGRLLLTLPFSKTLSRRRFSGETGKNDSLIDSIRDMAGQPSLTLELTKGVTEPEPVTLEGNTDLSIFGLNLRLDNSPREVVIYGHGGIVDLTTNPVSKVTYSPLITVGAGITLILRNITFKGLKQEVNGDKYNNRFPLIMVERGGKLVMEAGATIADNVNTYGSGDEERDAKNFGGGVNVLEGGIFILKDGTISGNTAGLGGGVHVWGTFTMEGGGKISGNTATGSGGGVCVNEGTFTMTGGTISKNTAQGNSNNKASIEGMESVPEFKDCDVLFQRNGGGGVYVLGEFTMTGGTISNNTSGVYGGGVLILGKHYVLQSSSSFKKTGGSIMSNVANSAADDNQVYAAAIALLLERSEPAFDFTYEFPYVDGAMVLRSDISAAEYYEAKRDSDAGREEDLFYEVGATTIGFE